MARGVQLSEARQVRVFAHDARSINIGAVNALAPDLGQEIRNGGTLYSVGDILASGTTDNYNIVVTSVGAGGIITGFKYQDTDLYSYDSGYSVGAIINTWSGGTGSGFQTTVTNIDIPRTGQVGACIFVGVAGDIEIEMESGKIATFKGMAAGSFMPVLAKRLISGQAAVGDLLALY